MIRRKRNCLANDEDFISVWEVMIRDGATVADIGREMGMRPYEVNKRYKELRSKNNMRKPNYSGNGGKRNDYEALAQLALNYPGAPSDVKAS